MTMIMRVWSAGLNVGFSTYNKAIWSGSWIIGETDSRLNESLPWSKSRQSGPGWAEWIMTRIPRH